jgi:nucleoid DNA-binding protein
MEDMAKAAAAKKPLSKSQVIAAVAEASGVPKKQVAACMDALAGEIKKALSPKGPGVFNLAGLIKIDKKKRPATPARKGVRNPFTGEIRDVPAKPASWKVRVRALKTLKAMI